MLPCNKSVLMVVGR